MTIEVDPMLKTTEELLVYRRVAQMYKLGSDGHYIT